MSGRGLATNLLTYSEDITNAAWLKYGSAQDVGITVTANVDPTTIGNPSAGTPFTANFTGDSTLEQVEFISGSLPVPRIAIIRK